jgi:hypothetical protein
MTRVEQIEAVIASLSEEEYAQFRRWFLDHIARRDATTELLEIPGLAEDVDDASDHIGKGHSKDWREVRKDIAEE